MSNYNTSVSTTDQSVTTADLSGVEAEKLQSVTGKNNELQVTDIGSNSGLVLNDANARDISMTVTDHGAVNNALGFARDFGSEAFTFGENALLMADKSSAAALSKTSEAIDQVGNLAETFKNGASSKTMLWLSLGVGVVAVVTVVAVTMGGNGK